MKRASVWVYQSHQSFDNVITYGFQTWFNSHNIRNHILFWFSWYWFSIAILKVSPTDHSYDGLDDSSQGSTALAQVKLQHTKSKKLRWLIYKISVLQYCFAPGSLKGELELHSLTSTPSWIQVFWHSSFLTWLSFICFSLESLAEEYTDEPSIGWKRRRRSEEIL